MAAQYVDLTKVSPVPDRFTKYVWKTMNANDEMIYHGYCLLDNVESPHAAVLSAALIASFPVVGVASR